MELAEAKVKVHLHSTNDLGMPEPNFLTGVIDCLLCSVQISLKTPSSYILFIKKHIVCHLTDDNICMNM